MSQTGKVLALFAVLFMLASPQGLSAEGLRGGFDDAFGPRFHPDARQAPPDSKHRPRHGFDRASDVRHWNQIAIDASGLDHTPVAPEENRAFFGEQLGPGRASRAMAIIHIAMFDAVNAIEGEYKSYTRVGRAPFGTSMKAAIAQAAHDTLVALFPSQAPSFDDQLADDLTEIPDGRLKTNGIALGRRTAAAILAARANDGSQHPEPHVGKEFFTSDDPGKWRQDPISLIPLALGAYWGEVKPFVLERADQFRVPPPPRLDSREYAVAFDEVKVLGGDGVVTPTVRTAEQTQIGIYWAYDGTPSLCAPPRLYNQIAMTYRAQDGHGHRCPGARAASGPRERRHGGRRHRRVGIQILLSVLAAGHRHSRSRRTHGAERLGRRQSRDGRRQNLFAARGAGQQSLGAELYAAVPSLSLRPCRVRRGAFRDAPELLPDRSHPIHLRFGRVQRRDAGQQWSHAAAGASAASHRSPRRRKKTGRAASISVSTGRSTRPRASRRAAA